MIVLNRGFVDTHGSNPTHTIYLAIILHLTTLTKKNDLYLTNFVKAFKRFKESFLISNEDLLNAKICCKVNQPFLGLFGKSINKSA